MTTKAKNTKKTSKSKDYDDMSEQLSELVESIDIDVAGEYPDVAPVPEGTPSDYDLEWSEYLLDQLADHELINGAPTVDGLRRITEKCFGEIVESQSTIVEAPAQTTG